jgi:predicted metal-dependent hydrolase
MPPEVSISLPNGATVQLAVRRSARARRIALRLLEQRGIVELVLPARASLKAGRRFADEKAGWIQKHLGALPPPVRFVEGASVPVLGEPVLLRGHTDRRGSAQRINGSLYVPGATPDFSIRVERWLRAAARREIVPRVMEKANGLGEPVARISVRDPMTSWGSCSAGGNLSFSWRLILGPPFVLDYVVAHEVAHLVHLNHGARFWTLVDDLTDAPDSGRRWLRKHGAALRRYG